MSEGYVETICRPSICMERTREKTKINMKLNFINISISCLTGFKNDSHAHV
jgi:hypothetical protein